RQCKVPEPSSVLPFYWHPNFHPAADTSWISRQVEWAKFAEENPRSPWVAPKCYTKVISTMPGWDASYPSMAQDKDATRIEHCQTLLESLSGKEDPKNTAVWRLLTTQSGCNFFNPDNIIAEYIKTEDALDQMVPEIKGKGAGPPWYQIFPIDIMGTGTGTRYYWYYLSWSRSRILDF
ncbi:MAG: hypothetical protein GY861_00890, partial [bacterium]|nr:hypothetical protein [bacterium]